MTTIWKTIFYVFLLSFFACEEEYSLDDFTLPPVLIVDGDITTDFTRHTIQLTTSGDFQEAVYSPATGASVNLLSGQQTHVLTEVEPGVYRTDSLAGIAGDIYQLHIDWEGEVYTAQDTMPALPTAFEPVTFVRGERGGWEFEYRRHQFGFATPNAWELRIALLDSVEIPFPPSSIDRLGQQIGVDVDEQGSYHFTFYTHPQIEVNGLLNFEEAHFYGYINPRIVTQRALALSPGAYEYLRQVFLETEWRGTIFDTTPANVQGNVSNGALGFFSARAVRDTTFVLE